MAPKKLASLFEDYMHLLELDSDNFAEEFGRKNPSLVEYAEAIDKYQLAAHNVRYSCTDDVRTGED